MRILRPAYYFSGVTHIDLAFLRQSQVQGLILDIDNTLSVHGSPTPGEGIERWLSEMHTGGIRLILLSNNRGRRVKPFAARLGLDFVANGAKPMKKGFEECIRRLDLPSRHIAVVGDQLFTDVAGGNRLGIRAILVDPISPENGWFFRFKRRLERRPMRNIEKIR